MHLTVVIDVDVPDDGVGRQLIAVYLSVDTKEGDVRDQAGIAIGHWKIDP